MNFRANKNLKYKSFNAYIIRKYIDKKCNVIKFLSHRIRVVTGNNILY